MCTTHLSCWLLLQELHPPLRDCRLLTPLHGIMCWSFYYQFDLYLANEQTSLLLSMDISSNPGKNRLSKALLNKLSYHICATTRNISWVGYCFCLQVGLLIFISSGSMCFKSCWDILQRREEDRKILLLMIKMIWGSDGSIVLLKGKVNSRMTRQGCCSDVLHMLTSNSIY